MILYIAAPFGDYARANSVADLLRASDHEVSSRWHIEAREMAEQGLPLRDPLDPKRARETNERNLDDLDRAHSVVVLLDGAHPPYTTLIELGYALNRAAHIYVVAPHPRRVGLHHRCIELFASPYELVAALVAKADTVPPPAPTEPRIQGTEP